VDEKSRLQIILIEDDDSHAKIIARYLNQLDEPFTVTHARTLRQGLKLLSENNFHIILLDLRLSDSDIDSTLEKTLQKSADVPIIILSSIEDKILTRKMVHAGAQDYLCKGELSSEILIRTIYSSIERKKAEISLRESEIRKAKTINSSLDCIVSIDEQGKIIEFNQAAVATFGFSKEEAIGKDMADLIIPERLQKQHRQGMAHFLATGVGPILGKRIEMPALRKNGQEFPVEVSIVAIELSNQKIFTSFIRDIADQKRAAKELQAAKDAAESANLAKSTFLANMSHEIRTPLGAVLGFSELLLNSQIGPSEKIRFASAIKHNGELLSKIINDILDLSKVEAGKMETEIKAVNLREVCTDTQSLLDLKASNKGIALNFTIDTDVPKIIFTDPIRLKQILLNIVGNAIKFTDKGYVQVQIKLDKSLLKSPKIIFIVEDSGRGISSEHAAKLFALFSQADNSTKRNFGGTGLGLFLSKRLSNLLGGDIKLTDSRLGQGSTFTLTIDPGPYDATEVKPEQFKKTSLNVNFDRRLDGLKILLVDDSSDNRLLVSKFLMITGAEVDIVTNGLEAVQKAKDDNYDVLLMDLQMPIMDGYEATALLRQKGYSAPIVALTAHAMIEERNRCLSSGFDDHISKPVDRRLLIERIYSLSHKRSVFNANN